MERRELGRSGIAIAPLMFGGNVFGWTVDQDKAFVLLDAFLDLGFNAIDTADVYTRQIPGHVGGESETIIGAWLKARGLRDRVVVATKCGHDMGDRKRLSRANIMHSVDASLKRLQTDYIDLYQAHRDDPDTPLAETLEAFADLIKAGKVRAIGASNYSAPRLEEALRISAASNLQRFETLQPAYNLYTRASFETELEPLCRTQNLSVLPYYGLASGFLTGKYRSEKDFDKSPRGRRMTAYINPRGLRILDALDHVAGAYGATPASVALAWLMARPTVAAPIASATQLAHIKAFATATRIRLGAYALNELENASREDA